MHEVEKSFIWKLIRKPKGKSVSCSWKAIVKWGSVIILSHRQSKEVPGLGHSVPSWSIYGEFQVADSMSGCYATNRTLSCIIVINLGFLLSSLCKRSTSKGSYYARYSATFKSIYVFVTSYDFASSLAILCDKLKLLLGKKLYVFGIEKFCIVVYLHNRLTFLITHSEWFGIIFC
jgi:hypothetical protein